MIPISDETDAVSKAFANHYLPSYFWNASLLYFARSLPYEVSLMNPALTRNQLSTLADVSQPKGYFSDSEPFNPAPWLPGAGASPPLTGQPSDAMTPYW